MVSYSVKDSYKEVGRKRSWWQEGPGKRDETGSTLTRRRKGDDQVRFDAR
jgi:hypothetical protein